MTRLNKTNRTQLIYALQNGASYRDTLDLSYFLKLGITEAEIGFYDRAIDLLMKCPWFDEEDFFTEEAMSPTQSKNILGGFLEFKKLLGIEDYTFSAWLQQQDVSNGLAIPYFLYQKFWREIREDFMEDKRLQNNLKIVLSNEQQFQYINIHDVAECVVPATDLESAVATVLIYCVTHKCNSLDTERCIIEIEDRLTHTTMSIEVKCLASHFCEKTDLSVCIIDDTTPIKGMPKVRNIMLLQDLASV
ncbi:hypothetical protein ACE1OE_17235 [Vibrio sp. E150_011]